MKLKEWHENPYGIWTQREGNYLSDNGFVLLPDGRFIKDLKDDEGRETFVKDYDTISYLFEDNTTGEDEYLAFVVYDDEEYKKFFNLLDAI